MHSYLCKRNFSSCGLDGASFYVPFGAKILARISSEPHLYITQNVDVRETVVLQYKKRTCVTKVSKFLKYFKGA